MAHSERYLSLGWYVARLKCTDQVDYARWYGSWNGLVRQSNIWEREGCKEDVQISSVSFCPRVNEADVRLSGYMLVILVLGTAFLGGAQSMWAKRIEGIYRIAVILAYWIGLPAIGLGVLLRIR
jgi:hypothetical protein